MGKSDSNSVSVIHKRWSFTRVNPSSYKISYLISLLAGAVVIVLTCTSIFKVGTSMLLIHLAFGLAAMTGSLFLDFYALRGTSLNNITKVFHVSAFSNLLWALTIFLGIVSHTIFSKTTIPSSYVIEGMLLAVGMRIGIFVSVFGTGITRAIFSAFIQPIVFLLAFVPLAFYASTVSIITGIIYGSIFIILALAWARLADKAGRPDVKSTFNVLQAFLAAWTENSSQRMEEIAEARANKEKVTTYIARFRLINAQVSMILPDLHPGPFNPIGGSNLPYVLYSEYSRNAIILHSVSNHSRNLPSKSEVDNYIQTLSQAKVSQRCETSTVPFQTRIGRSTATGIIFGNTAMVILSMAPVGMEDVPESIRIDLERYSSHLGLKHILVVDSHNAMGEDLKKSEFDTLLSAGKNCLKELINAPQYEFKVGFANMDDISCNPTRLKEELGQSGLATIVFEVNGNQYVIGWADSNNMHNNLRDNVITKLARNGIQTLELCTSDTHSTSGKRTRQGYYALGNISKHEEIAEIYLQLSKKAIEKATSARFELASSVSMIKVMGKRQFDDYALALNRSMNITKIFLAITSAVFVAMLIFS
jgi:putative membrane protein